MQDLNLSMFRAYDIRCPARDLPPALARRLAAAQACYFRDDLGVGEVVLAHDARTSGPTFLAIAAEVFRRAGLTVQYLPGASTASHFYYTVMENPASAAVMFGASHNPAGDTGQKLLAPGARPIARHIGPLGGLDRIQELYLAGAEPSPAARMAPAYAVDNMERYVRYSLGLAGVSLGHFGGLKSGRPVRVLQDYLYGAGGPEMMLGMQAAGVDLTPLHFVPDGSFPLGDPNPVKPKVIAEGLAALQQGDYLLATFFDGDADRVDFYAGNGTYLASSFVYAAILPYVLEQFPGGRDRSIFADLKANPLAVIEMARAGVQVGVIRNGHSQIKEAMLQDDRVIGAVEESAHFYQRFSLAGKGPYCTENTLYLALLVTRVWAEHPERFQELLALQAKTAREREWGHHFPNDAARQEAMQAVEEHFAGQGLEARAQGAGGLELEATLMRRGLPFAITPETVPEPDWLQVCQRISQSEDGLARWEVVAATPQIAGQAKADIERLVAAFGAGAPYQG